MTTRRSLRGVALPASLATLLLLAACAAPAADPTATPTDSELLAPAAVDLPEPDVDLGTVVAGTPAEVQRSGTATVGFEAPDEVALVATVDCSACTGPIEVSSPDRGSAWGTGTAPLTAQYLIALTGPATTDRIQVNATGDWTLTLSSSADLPASTGEQTGTGPVVLRLTEQGGHVRVRAEQTVTIRMLSTEALGEDGEPPSTTSGADGGIDQAFLMAMPGLVALDTAGPWTVQVLP